MTDFLDKKLLFNIEQARREQYENLVKEIGELNVLELWRARKAIARIKAGEYEAKDNTGNEE